MPTCTTKLFNEKFSHISFPHLRIFSPAEENFSFLPKTGIEQCPWKALSFEGRLESNVCAKGMNKGREIGQQFGIMENNYRLALCILSWLGSAESIIFFRVIGGLMKKRGISSLIPIGWPV